MRTRFRPSRWGGGPIVTPGTPHEIFVDEGPTQRVRRVPLVEGERIIYGLRLGKRYLLSREYALREKK